MVQYWLHAAEVRYRFNARQFGGSIGATISKETAVLLHLAGKVAHAVFGQFPRRALALVLEWRELHQVQLLSNWHRARRGEPLESISPLE